MKDLSSLSDAELMAAYKSAKDPFASALSAEGVTGPVADLARSIYTQESGGGKNTKTSNAGAVGGMQIIPATFKSVADKDWDINDPTQNARAGIRYVKQLYEQAGGDPALTAAGYYGGPGGLEKARRGVAVSDPRNPNAPNTLQYGEQVAARLPKEKGLIQRGVEAVIPSANAAETPANPLESMSDEELLAAYQKAKAPVEQPAPSTPAPTMGERVSSAAKLMGAGVARDIGLGALRGSARIGNTIINAGTKAGADAIGDINDPNGLIDPKFKRPAAGVSNLVTGQKPTSPIERDNASRIAGLTEYDKTAPTNLAYQLGDVGAQIAGTAGVGGALAAPLKAAGVLPRVALALQTGGMTVGGAPASTLAQGVANLVPRVVGGAISGGASAGLVDPGSARTGALIGGALPAATMAAGTVGRAIGRSVTGGAMAPEVKVMANRAKELGIDIPADRLVNSRPLNALAGSLEYVPLSGRAATLDKMQDQLNVALSKTFGQNSDNVTAALRKAQGDLGGKFDQVLKSNTVKVDQQFMTDLADAANMASKELGTDGAKIIGNQVDEIMLKAANGEIDGQAAYNIKRTLDRISQRNSPEAYYARDLKSKLMAALDRSLGPQQAADFALVRKQYGNMLALENLAQNGAEGNISIARLANMKNINNPDLQELADISAQFLKPREGAHGSAQRVFGGMGALGTGTTAAMLGVPAVPMALAAGAAAGRGANSLLNSRVVKNAISGTPQSNQLLQFARSPEVEKLLYRSAPVVGSQ
ncbi:hypothetical protein ABIC89_001067 [Variovorax boronicumulans]|uniref:lytic transglycosylase domain-containing protein n=1 Tax=Variovorax boronicumulans TaxID=436515 RepID=UPI003396F0C4